MKLTVLGAGAWGTALAAHAAHRHPVALWARDADQARALQAQRRNVRYLPEVALPSALLVTDDFEAAVHGTDADGLLLVATPMDGLEPTLRRLAAVLPAVAGGSGPAIGWLCKGLRRASGELGHEIAERVLPGNAPVVVSGPSFALEVGRGQPTALVAASHAESSARRAVDALHDRTLRVYTSNDPVGVEVGGAVKNVLAIATGIADGLPWGDGGSPAGLGLNARAALITRGLAEMTRLGVATGARPETFMGLGGLGDLVLTATGSLSRNRQVGLALAQGQPLDAILAALGHVAEGVSSAPVVLERAQRLGVDMPITEAVVAVLGGRLTPAAALARLLERDARAEGT